MSHCRLCGALLQAGGRFCAQCGAQVELPSPPSQGEEPGLPSGKDPASSPANGSAAQASPGAPSLPIEPPLQRPPLTPGGRVRVRPPVSAQAKPAPPPPPPPRVDLEQDTPSPANPPLPENSRVQVWEKPAPAQPGPPAPPPAATPENERPCSSCGRPLAPAAKFCHCGAQKITPPPEPAPAPPVAPVAPTCPHCGQEVTPQARFCRHCGGAVMATAPAPPSDRCPQCREPISPGARFCRQCGAPVPTASGPPPPPHPLPVQPGAAAWSETQPDRGGWRYAGFWWRALALSLDAVLVGVVFGGFSLLVFGPIAASPFALMHHSGQALPYSLLNLVFVWLYFALAESSPWQATPGKKALGLKVTDLAGRRLGFARASARTFAKYLSGLILGIGYLMAGFTRRKQALHDLLAGCLVWKIRS